MEMDYKEEHDNVFEIAQKELNEIDRREEMKEMELDPDDYDPFK